MTFLKPYLLLLHFAKIDFPNGKGYLNDETI